MNGSSTENNLKNQLEGYSDMEIDSVINETTTFQHKIIIFDWDNTLFCTKYLEMLNPDFESIFSGRSCLEDLGSYLMDEISNLERVKLPI